MLVIYQNIIQYVCNVTLH